MGATSYTIRDDHRYTVIVGWEEELETFFAYVFDGTARDGEPLFALGQEPHEVPTISQLAGAIGRFADLDPRMISVLRNEAKPLA